jgi:hypothetical protein
MGRETKLSDSIYLGISRLTYKKSVNLYFLEEYESTLYSPILTRQEQELLQYEYRTGCNTGNYPCK